MRIGANRRADLQGSCGDSITAGQESPRRQLSAARGSDDPFEPPGLTGGRGRIFLLTIDTQLDIEVLSP